MATSSSAALLYVHMEAVNYGLLSSALAAISSSVLLFVHRDRTDYGALLWQLFLLQCSFTSTETVRITEFCFGDFFFFSVALRPQRPYGLRSSALAIFSSSVLLYVHRDRTDY